jgi:hypothetical protein
MTLNSTRCAAGCERIWTDTASGKLARRPKWDACLDYLRAGDELVITRLSRMARSVRHLTEIAALLDERGVDLVVLKQGIDTTTAAGRFLFHVIGAMDEMLADLISEGTLEGLDALDWVARVWLRYPDSKLSECWARHPHMVEELWWCRNAWLDAYAGKKASWKQVGDWHDRQRPNRRATAARRVVPPGQTRRRRRRTQPDRADARRDTGHHRRLDPCRCVARRKGTPPCPCSPPVVPGFGAQPMRLWVPEREFLDRRGRLRAAAPLRR